MNLLFWRKKKEQQKITTACPYKIGDIIYESIDSCPKYPSYVYDIKTSWQQGRRKGDEHIITSKHTLHLVSFVTEFHTNKIKFLCFKVVDLNSDLYVAPVPTYHNDKIKEMIINYGDTGVLSYSNKSTLDLLNEEPDIYDKNDEWDCFIIDGNGDKFILAKNVSLANAEKYYFDIRKHFKNKMDYEPKSELNLKRVYIPYCESNRVILEKSRKI